MGALAVVLITAAPVAADAYQVPAPPSPTASCDVISPVAIPCVIVVGDVLTAEGFTDSYLYSVARHGRYAQ